MQFAVVHRGDGCGKQRRFLRWKRQDSESRRRNKKTRQKTRVTMRALVVDGLESLRLWGHTAVMTVSGEVIVFGGYGSVDGSGLRRLDDVVTLRAQQAEERLLVTATRLERHGPWPRVRTPHARMTRD